MPWLAVLVGCALASSWCGGTPTAPSAAPPVASLNETTETANDEADAPSPGEDRQPPPTGGGSTWINAFGDTGWCGSTAMPQVARLLDGLPGDILLVGDLAYMDGTIEDFRRCFDPDFGRFGRRLRPAPGNHEYTRPDANGYFSYFGDRAGPDRRGFYAFRAAAWQVLMLNSSVPIGRGSEQLAWVRQQLEREPGRCTLAAVHHPFDSSGSNGPNPWLRDLWSLLHEFGTDIVVSAHDHLYERFARQDANQRRDPVRGIRQFTAGTGGAPLYGRGRTSPNSEAFIQAHGVLRLRLDPAQYEWEFVDVNGGVLDRGFEQCQ